MSSRKRSRDECIDDGWWNRAVAFVRDSGGKVHESLQLSPTDRELYVDKNVAEGEELLVIPSLCLVSWTTVRCSSSLGLHVTSCVQAVAKSTSSLYSPIQDLAIALYLAAISTRNQEETTKFKPYLDTLPSTSTFDAIPRRWPDTQLRFLAGSPILDRVKRQKQGIQNDYNLIRDMWKKEHLDDKEFPNFDSFSDMLAAVSSRAFAGFGTDPNYDKGNHNGKNKNDNHDNDANIAMVPLLDLCNHSRGYKNMTKNVAYEQPPSLGSGGSVIVTARETINAGESLRITYGARSNQQLLLNYGFCIENNVEPDGSSNDFLEFYHVSVNDDQAQPQINPDHNVQLLAGPKAHAFHGFVNALDLFYNSLPPPSGFSNQEGDHLQDSERDDFEENEDDFDKWDMEMTDMGNDTDNYGDGHDDDDNDKSNDELRKQKEHQIIQVYVKALDAFAKELNERCKGYYLSGEKLEHALALQSSDPARHSALLVKSELRTIYFILLVIRRLQTLLTGTDSKIEKTSTEQIALQLSESDHQLLRDQAVALSSAFLQIRLPFWKAKSS
jgi:hypothetical protein